MKVAALHRSWTGNTLKSLLFVLYSVPFLHADLLVAGSCEDSGYPDQFSFACGENASMQWNADNSATDLGATATRTISILGGGGPYTWTVNGNGFYFDGAYTKKSITTVEPTTTLYTSNACGSSEVTVTNACGITVRGEVRSINGAWGRSSVSFRAINVYKPDEHDMFPFNVNGYSYSVPGRIYSSGKRYCMSKTNPGTVAGEGWFYHTWVVYTAPDGRSNHWAACRSHVGETVKDPIVGVIDIPVYGKTDVLINYGGCQNFHRHYALTGDFFIWEWKCGN